jgi:hypothetical protein
MVQVTESNLVVVWVGVKVVKQVYLMAMFIILVKYLVLWVINLLK